MEVGPGSECLKINPLTVFTLALRSRLASLLDVFRKFRMFGNPLEVAMILLPDVIRFAGAPVSRNSV